MFAISTIVLAVTAPAFAQHEQAFPFKGTNGYQPDGDLIADAAGNLYGVTQFGGNGNIRTMGFGVVYEMSPPVPPSTTWTETTLYMFNGIPDGALPSGNLAFDESGNLYGTTQGGGTVCGPPGCGTVFELSPPSQAGGTWTETVIHDFGAPGDGALPLAGPIVDAAGNLYGTTFEGGSGQFGYGTVFELSPPSQAGGAWSETILHNFGTFQDDGSAPAAPVVFDSAGNMYGTTSVGGPKLAGTVFELSPPPQPGGTWTETVLHNFLSIPQDGEGPMAGLTLTPAGELLGTAQVGGAAQHGIVFGLSSPNANGARGYKMLYSFSNVPPDGGDPVARVILQGGQTPELYGTTAGGGGGEGTVFQLTPPSSPGGAWTETILHIFTGGNDGAWPHAGLLLRNDSLYGTAEGGGRYGYGTVFRLSH